MPAEVKISVIVPTPLPDFLFCERQIRRNAASRAVNIELTSFLPPALKRTVLISFSVPNREAVPGFVDIPIL